MGHGEEGVVATEDDTHAQCSILLAFGGAWAHTEGKLLDGGEGRVAADG